MTVLRDPAGIELGTLKRMIDFRGLEVLEVGCGSGRLTWGYAGDAARVTAIDPNGTAIEEARTEMPPGLNRRVHLRTCSLEDFAADSEPSGFDLAIFAWSL